VQAEFAAFVQRKTREAIAAKLSPYVTEYIAADPRLVAIGNQWSTTHFDGPFYVSPPRSDRPSCSLVFVQSADGNTGANNPSLLGGGAVDLHVVYEGLSRVAADAVLAGAKTVRGERVLFSVWHPAMVELRQSLGLPRHPTQIVATARGCQLDAALLFNVPEVPVILLTTDAGHAAMATALIERPWIRVIDMERRLPSAFRQLRSLQINRVSCIGGHTLANELLDLNLVDDLYLTTSPRPGGDPGTSLTYDRAAASTVLRKHGTGDESGVIFEQMHFGARLSSLPGR
jgi:riboflavin biosynthesis pyrimidine reductase